MEKLKIALVTDMHLDLADPYQREQQAALLYHFVAAVNRYAPDLVVDMGDRVQGIDPEHDRQSIGALKSFFDLLNAPLHIVLGNKDLRTLAPKDHAAILKTPAKSHSLDIGDHHLIFWNPAYNRENSALHLGEDDTAWLENDLNGTERPSVLLSHIPLDRNDTHNEIPGHYWENPGKARKIMEQSKKVILCLSGHDHRRRDSDINGIYYSTRNAFRNAVENKAATPYSAYSFVELENRNIFIL